jgi:hypothetical protein
MCYSAFTVIYIHYSDLSSGWAWVGGPNRNFHLPTLKRNLGKTLLDCLGGRRPPESSIRPPEKRNLDKTLVRAATEGLLSPSHHRRRVLESEPRSTTSEKNFKILSRRHRSSHRLTPLVTKSSPWESGDEDVFIALNLFW